MWKIGSFIDDLMVGIESEEEYNELINEILMRMEENVIYIKPEKCKWKIREVKFLGVVIELDGIKMEK